jgi:hypothetical protein
MSWSDLENANPALAEFGRERFAKGIAFIATVREDGVPRVHPVTPIVGGGKLWLFMEPTSPKGHDLERGCAYAMHCLITDPSGKEGEFHINGRARRTIDAHDRAHATQHASYTPRDRYILFELLIDEATAKTYTDEGATYLRYQSRR